MSSANSFKDLSERCVLSVQVRAVAGHDKELTSGGIGHHAARHAQHAVSMLQGILHAVGRKLALDAVPRPPDPDPFGISSLDHKAGDDAVKGQPVIEAAVGQSGKIPDGLRRVLRIELAFHFASVTHPDGKHRILCHD